MMLPGLLFLYDHGSWRSGSIGQKLAYYAHVALILLGAFFLGGGTYGVVKLIQEAYAQHIIGAAFSCADNSDST